MSHPELRIGDVVTVAGIEYRIVDIREHCGNRRLYLERPGERRNVRDCQHVQLVRRG